MNLGARQGVANNARISAVKESKEDADVSEQPGSLTSENRVAYARGKQVYRKQRWPERQERGSCYICGEKHFWKICPDKRYSSCGQKGHPIRDCSTGHKGKDSVLTAETDGTGVEMSVLISIKLNGMPTSGLVDSSAGQSVIDLGTVRVLGLEELVQSKDGRVYGISREPVHIMGKLDLTVGLATKKSWSIGSRC